MRNYGAPAEAIAEFGGGSGPGATAVPHDVQVGTDGRVIVAGQRVVLGRGSAYEHSWNLRCYSAAGETLWLVDVTNYQPPDATSESSVQQVEIDGNGVLHVLSRMKGTQGIGEYWPDIYQLLRFNDDGELLSHTWHETTGRIKRFSVSHAGLETILYDHSYSHGDDGHIHLAPENDIGSLSDTSAVWVGRNYWFIAGSAFLSGYDLSPAYLPINVVNTTPAGWLGDPPHPQSLAIPGFGRHTWIAPAGPGRPNLSATPSILDYDPEIHGDLEEVMRVVVDGADRITCTGGPFWNEAASQLHTLAQLDANLDLQWSREGSYQGPIGCAWSGRIAVLMNGAFSGAGKRTPSLACFSSGGDLLWSHYHGDAIEVAVGADNSVATVCRPRRLGAQEWEYLNSLVGV